MVQVSSAGRAVIGWLSPISRKNEWPQLKSWPPDVVEPRKPNRPGIFVVDTTKYDRDRGWLMYWDLQDAVDYNKRDPHEILVAVDYLEGQTFKIGYFQAAEQNKIILRFDPGAREGDIFYRYRPSARIPWTIGQTLPEAAKANYFSQHVRPFPPTEKWHIANRLRGPKALLENWTKSPTAPSAIRRAARDKIADFLHTWHLEEGALDRAIQNEIRSTIKLELGDPNNSFNMVRLDDRERTYLEWYRVVAAEDRDDKSGKPNKSFEILGLAPEKGEGYAYIVSFMKARASGFAVVGFGVAGFTASIRRVGPVKFKLEDGRWKRDKEDVPQLVDPSVLTDERQGVKIVSLNNPLVGVFADVGIGIGYEADPGLSEHDGKASAKAQVTGGSGILDSVTFYSSERFDYDDFAKATFKITAVKGPTAKVGNYVSVNAFSSIYHNWTTRHGTSLDAIQTKYFDLKPPELPKWTLILKGWKSIKEYV
jgi:hypothetical protein